MSSTLLLTSSVACKDLFNFQILTVLTYKIVVTISTSRACYINSISFSVSNIVIETIVKCVNVEVVWEARQ